jgi:hypothetical protein
MVGGLTFALVCALLAIVYGVWQSVQILKLPDGNERMREIAAAIREGATAYLWRQYKSRASGPRMSRPSSASIPGATLPMCSSRSSA